MVNQLVKHFHFVSGIAKVRATEFITELSYKGSICTKDCSGHKAGDEWSQAHDDTRAYTPSRSFNNGTLINYSAANNTRGAGRGGKIAGQLSPTADAERKRKARAQRRVKPPEPVSQPDPV